MNLNNLRNSLNAVSYCGHTLSIEDFCVLENSLYVLQNENHFTEVFLWGRIFGIEDDYFIAYGYDKDVLRDRKYYYSTNCLDWGLLPHPTYNAFALTPLFTSRFQGDPTFLFDILNNNPMDPPGSPIREPDLPICLKEEDLLAATVAIINDEVAVVPRGSLYKGPQHTVVDNKMFQGLTYEEAGKLQSYQHFRPPQLRWNTSLLTRKDFNVNIDFLDTIDLDYPEERAWTQSFKEGGAVTILQSLYWPGMTFYHKLMTREYGFYYCGIGRKNMDIPWMLDFVKIKTNTYHKIC